MSSSLPRLLTPAEVAEALAVSTKTILREVADGRLGATRVRGSVRFTEQQVLAYLEQQRTGPAAKPSVEAQQQPAAPARRAPVRSKSAEPPARRSNERVAALWKATEILYGRTPQGE